MISPRSAKRGVHVTILAAVCACVPVKETYYLPTGELVKSEDRYCGYPSGGNFNTLGDGVRLSIRGTPGDGDLWLSLQLVVDKGHTLRFQDNVLEILEANGSRHHVRLTSESGGRYPSLDPTIPIIGSPPDLNIANVVIKDISPDSFRLTLPRLEVDGVEMSLEAIEFVRVEKRGIAYCIQ